MMRGETYVAERACRHGHPPLRYRKSRTCVACAQLAQQRFRAGIGIAARRHYDSEHMRRHRADPRLALIENTRQAARRSGIACDLDSAAVTLPAGCPCCGVLWEYPAAKHVGKPSPSAAPIMVRLDPALGYTMANSRIVCRTCAAVIGTAGVDRVHAVGRWLGAELAATAVD